MAYEEWPMKWRAIRLRAIRLMKWRALRKWRAKEMAGSKEMAGYEMAGSKERPLSGSLYNKKWQAEEVTHSLVAWEKQQ
jgi:hypothetical protein